jgi:hypothetical protein
MALYSQVEVRGGRLEVLREAQHIQHGTEHKSSHCGRHSLHKWAWGWVHGSLLHLMVPAWMKENPQRCQLCAMDSGSGCQCDAPDNQRGPQQITSLGIRLDQSNLKGCEDDHPSPLSCSRSCKLSTTVKRTREREKTSQRLSICPKEWVTNFPTRWQMSTAAGCLPQN